MKELATYIDESFFKNVGSEKAVTIAKGQQVVDELEKYILKNGIKIQKIVDTYRRSETGSRSYNAAYQEIRRLNAEIEKSYIFRLPIDGVIYITTKEYKGSESLDFIKTSGVGPIAFKKVCDGSPKQMSLLQTHIHIQNGKYVLSNFGSYISNSTAVAALCQYGELCSSNKYCLGFYYDK